MKSRCITDDDIGSMVNKLNKHKQKYVAIIMALCYKWRISSTVYGQTNRNSNDHCACHFLLQVKSDSMVYYTMIIACFTLYYEWRMVSWLMNQTNMNRNGNDCLMCQPLLYLVGEWFYDSWIKQNHFTCSANYIGLTTVILSIFTTFMRYIATTYICCVYITI